MSATAAGGVDGIVSSVEDGVLTVRMAVPDKRNALDQAAQERLVAVLESAALDDSLRAVHLTGEGDHFCAGADWVAANAGGGKPRPAHVVRRLPLQSHRIVELLLTIQLPVVATVRGTAAGLGCQLALAADFALAADDATFWEPFVLRGFTPDSGSTWLLPRLIGLARARRMLLLGEKVSATDAADWGLIHQAVSPPALDSTAEELVQRLACGPTAAIGLAKQALGFGQHATLSQSLTQELFNLELSCRTGDFKEGLEAFQQRRAPKFHGR